MNRQTLIILPGWGGTKETWNKFIEIANKDFDVKAIELPCFGDEPCPNEVWGVEEYADFVKSKVKSQKSKVILMGHSFGGQVATYLVANNPNLVDKLILSGPAVFRPKKTINVLFWGFIAKIGNLLFKIPFVEKFKGTIRNFFHCLIGAKDYNKTSGIQAEIFKKAIRQDLTSELSKINIPTLIIWGDKDSYVPVSDAYKLNKLVINSKLEIISGGKHGLHLQMPEILSKLVYDFSN